MNTDSEKPREYPGSPESKLLADYQREAQDLANELKKIEQKLPLIVEIVGFAYLQAFKEIYQLESDRVKPIAEKLKECIMQELPSKVVLFAKENGYCKKDDLTILVMELVSEKMFVKERDLEIKNSFEKLFKQEINRLWEEEDRTGELSDDTEAILSLLPKNNPTDQEDEGHEENGNSDQTTQENVKLLAQIRSLFPEPPTPVFSESVEENKVEELQMTTPILPSDEKDAETDPNKISATDTSEGTSTELPMNNDEKAPQILQKEPPNVFFKFLIENAQGKSLLIPKEHLHSFFDLLFEELAKRDGYAWLSRAAKKEYYFDGEKLICDITFLSTTHIEGISVSKVRIGLKNSSLLEGFTATMNILPTPNRFTKILLNRRMKSAPQIILNELNNILKDVRVSSVKISSTGLTLVKSI